MCFFWLFIPCPEPTTTPGRVPQLSGKVRQRGTPGRPNGASGSVRTPPGEYCGALGHAHQPPTALRSLWEALGYAKIGQKSKKPVLRGTARRAPWSARAGSRAARPVSEGQRESEGTRPHRCGSFASPQRSVKSRQNRLKPAPVTDFRGLSAVRKDSGRAPRTGVMKGGTHALHIDRCGLLGGPGGLAIKGFPHAQKSPFTPAGEAGKALDRATGGRAGVE